MSNLRLNFAPAAPLVMQVSGGVRLVFPPATTGAVQMRVQGIQGPPGSSSGITDGDKGDVTVSASGEVWTINDAVVTDAKIVSLSWGKITDAPVFAAVATSGAYGDLSGRPVLGTAAAADVGDFATAAQGALAATALQPGASIPWADVSGKPAFAAVATSGSAADLTGTLAAARIADESLALGKLAVAVPQLAAAQNFSAAQGVTPVALTDAATIATDAALSNVFTVTLGGNRTLGNPTNLVAGRTYAWIVTQGAGGNALAFASYFDFPGGAAPTLSPGAGDVDLIVGIALSSTRVLCVANLDFS